MLLQGLAEEEKKGYEYGKELTNSAVMPVGKDQFYFKIKNKNQTNFKKGK